MKQIVNLSLMAICVAMFGCSDKQAQPCEIAPIYSIFPDYESLDEHQRDSLMERYDPELQALFSVYELDTVCDAVMRSWAHTPAVEIFTPDVDSVYTDLSGVSIALGAILHNAQEQGIDLPKRRYAAVVWGNMKSIIATDSVMLIALNHYLGADYKGYNNSVWPAYMRGEKTPQNLPYDLAEALMALQYPYQGGENVTALSRMLYEGALIEAKMRLVPDATEAAALGYTDSQLDWFVHNIKDLWQTMVARKMLYDTSADVASRLVDRAPATSILAPYVPPRAGRYVGYQIVKAYLEKHPDTPLAALFAPEFYNSESTLIEADYSAD